MYLRKLVGVCGDHVLVPCSSLLCALLIWLRFKASAAQFQVHQLRQHSFTSQFGCTERNWHAHDCFCQSRPGVPAGEKYAEQARLAAACLPLTAQAGRGTVPPGGCGGDPMPAEGRTFFRPKHQKKMDLDAKLIANRGKRHIMKIWDPFLLK